MIKAFIAYCVFMIALLGYSNYQGYVLFNWPDSSSGSTSGHGARGMSGSGHK